MGLCVSSKVVTEYGEEEELKVTGEEGKEGQNVRVKRDVISDRRTPLSSPQKNPSSTFEKRKIRKAQSLTLGPRQRRRSLTNGTSSGLYDDKSKSLSKSFRHRSETKQNKRRHRQRRSLDARIRRMSLGSSFASSKEEKSKESKDAFYCPEYENKKEDTKIIDEYTEQWLSTSLTQRKHYVSVLFCDICSFTSWCREQFGCEENIFEMLSFWFMSLDDVLEKFPKVYKLETIGDCIVCVCNLPHRIDTHAEYLVNFAFAVLDLVEKIRDMMRTTFKCDFRVRIGINTGYVVAGTIQASKRHFQIFGNTINIAARMESTGAPNRVHVSDVTKNTLANRHDTASLFRFEERDTFVKGQGDVHTYFVTRANDALSSSERPSAIASSATSNDVVVAYNGEDMPSPVAISKRFKKNTSQSSSTSQKLNGDSAHGDSAPVVTYGRQAKRRHSIGGRVSSSGKSPDSTRKIFIVDKSLATCKLLSKAVWQSDMKENIEYTTSLASAREQIKVCMTFVKILIIGIRPENFDEVLTWVQDIRANERERSATLKQRKIIVALASENIEVPEVRSRSEHIGVDYLWPKTYFKHPKDFTDALTGAMEIEKSQHSLYRTLSQSSMRLSSVGSFMDDSDVASVASSTASFASSVHSRRWSMPSRDGIRKTHLPSVEFDEEDGATRVSSISRSRSNQEDDIEGQWLLRRKSSIMRRGSLASTFREALIEEEEENEEDVERKDVEFVAKMSAESGGFSGTPKATKRLPRSDSSPKFVAKESAESGGFSGTPEATKKLPSSKASISERDIAFLANHIFQRGIRERRK